MGSGAGFRAIFAAAALLGAASAHADLVSIGASRDNTILEEDAEASNGAGDYFFVGNTRDGFARRALVAFDVAAAIPAGSTIDAVTLRLHLSRTRTQDQTVSVHRVLSDWGEGTSDAGGEEGAGVSATQDDATWLYTFFDPSDPPSSPAWIMPGGDFDPSASAAILVGNGTGFWDWTGPGLVSDVQAWLDGTSADNGWILLSNETNTRVAKRFDSRDHPDSSVRPVLLVQFTPASLTGACCDPDGSCSVVLDPGGACSGSYEGPGTSCTPNPCPQPTGACCFADALGSCQEATEAACATLGGSFAGEFSTCAATACPVIPTPYLDPLPRPGVAVPTSVDPDGTRNYTIAMREVQQQLHAELPPTTVWGYGDGPSGASYPGPSFEATVGVPFRVTWANDLRDTSVAGSPLRTTHALAVDTCPHGAAANADARTVVHLHGGHVKSEFDGHPELTIPPGASVVYEYPNWQPPATLWYHDHALGITRLNVQMGLAGFWLLRDVYETSLGLPAGEFEIPLAIQDRSFDPDGSLRYPATWQEMFFGDVNLVNGKVWPYLAVKQGKYRFRLLNGAGSRTYRLSLSSDDSFHVIGMEGGLLPAPVQVSHVTLGPGERADVVVDFAGYPAGAEILLVNDAPAPFPGTAGAGVVADVLKFVVTNEPGHVAALPGALRPMELLHEADATQFRELHLEKVQGADACSPAEWLIRSVVGGAVVGEKWVDVTEQPELGDTEVWSFVNKSGVTHPMHMHLVMFQVLDRQAFELQGGVVVPIGSRVPPPAHEAGWKDTVQVGPNEIVRVIARFEDYTGLFSYHCHILEHEDHEMMRQFQAVATAPQCGNGLDDDSDGLVDFAGGDPGCESALDGGEHGPRLACDDGIDNDGDGDVDTDDLGCWGPTAVTESPECEDGIDNDGDGFADWDGAGLGAPDPQCTQPWSKERPKRCGLGPEAAGLLLALGALRRRRRGRRRG